MNKNSHKNSK
jgi:hypothetical protein